MEFFVNDQIRQQRVEHCQTCEHITMFNTCELCNCFMPMKTKLPGAACPKGKWSAVNASAEQEQIN